jgi:hypothetical protein
MLVNRIQMPALQVASYCKRNAPLALSRSMSLSGVKGFSDKDRAAEQSEFPASFAREKGSLAKFGILDLRLLFAPKGRN